MCSGILVSCFLAVFDSSTFTVPVYPCFGYSQVSPGSDFQFARDQFGPWSVGFGAKQSFQRSWSPKVRATELGPSIQGSINGDSRSGRSSEHQYGTVTEAVGRRDSDHTGRNPRYADPSGFPG